MKRYIGISSLGELCRDTTTSILPIQENVTFIEIPLEEYVDINLMYWDNGFIKKPLKEFDYQTFDYVTKTWKDLRTDATEWVIVKQKRSVLLTVSDWVMIKTLETGIPIPEVWVAYRKALRDITLQPDVFNIIWPTAPQG